MDLEVENLRSIGKSLSGRPLMLACILLLTALGVASLPALSADGYEGPALEWRLVTPLPEKVDYRQEFQVQLNLTNKGTVDLSGGNRVTLEIVVRGNVLDSENVHIPLNESVEVTFSITILTEGYADITLDARYDDGDVALYDTSGGAVDMLGTVWSRYQGAGVEWTLDSALPSRMETGERLQISLTLANEGTVDLSGGNRVTIEITIRGNRQTEQVIELRKDESMSIDFSLTIEEEGAVEIHLNSFYRSGIVNLYNSTTKRRGTLLGTVNVETVEEPFNWIPIIVIVVVAVAGIGGFMVYSRRKAAKVEAQRLEEEARRQELIRKKEEEIAKKIEVKQVVGKHPRDYYVLHRHKYATLRPSGMTSSGLTILKRQKTKEELEAEQRVLCPKCGTELSEEGVECPKCDAIERIEKVRYTIRGYKSRTTADFNDAEALLRKAEHRISWSDFSMALDFVEKAETRTEEIWQAAEKGEVIEQTVMEYAEARGPSIDSKIVGLQGEETAMPVTPVETAAPIAEEAPSRNPCPECGNPMVDDECLICNFDSVCNFTWATIEKAEMDGANMEEVKDLCRQATNARERGSDELALRYLRRARRIAPEEYHKYARSKTEGIIKYTKAMVARLKTEGEDVALAEQMIEGAEAAMERGDYADARSMTTKADGFLKQLREDSYKKRIGELFPAVTEAAETNAEVAKLLDKAKKLIEAKEYEGAVDLIEAAHSKL